MSAAEDKIRFSELADEMGLDGDDKDDFIGWSMMKKGYQAVTDWMDPEPVAEPPKAGNSPWSRSVPAGNSTPVKRVAAPIVPARRASGGQYS